MIMSTTFKRSSTAIFLRIFRRICTHSFSLARAQYTATESTNYFFDVEASQLLGATDRFAQFFQTPLFTASSMERELQAVDSEHANNKNQDTWRLYQVNKSMTIADCTVVVVTVFVHKIGGCGKLGI